MIHKLTTVISAKVEANYRWFFRKGFFILKQLAEFEKIYIINLIYYEQFRNYQRKVDMETPTKFVEDDDASTKDSNYKELFDKYLKYGIKQDWLTIWRIIGQRWVFQCIAKKYILRFKILCFYCSSWKFWTSKFFIFRCFFEKVLYFQQKVVFIVSSKR